MSTPDPARPGYPRPDLVRAGHLPRHRHSDVRSGVPAVNAGRSAWRRQWDAYGERPPAARWTARFSFAVLGPAVLLAVLCGIGWLAWWAFRVVFL